MKQRLGCLAACCVALASSIDDDAAASTGLEGVGWGVGARVGVRRIGANHETGGAAFWVAAPVGPEAWAEEAFGVVSASLWFRGRWGGAESVIASGIFARYCGGGALVADVGSHVGYFTLLARAHGCDTRSVDANPSFAQLVRVSLGLNGFAPTARDVREGLVPDDVTYDSLVGGAGRVLFAKFDIEGAEADALTRGADALRRTDFVYVELSVEDDAARACAAGGGAFETLARLYGAGFDVHIILGSVAGGGYPRCGVLAPIDRHAYDREATVAETCAAVYALRTRTTITFDLYGSRPDVPLPPPASCGRFLRDSARENDETSSPSRSVGPCPCRTSTAAARTTSTGWASRAAPTAAATSPSRRSPRSRPRASSRRGSTSTASSTSTTPRSPWATSTSPPRPARSPGPSPGTASASRRATGP